MFLIFDRNLARKRNPESTPMYSPRDYLSFLQVCSLHLLFLRSRSAAVQMQVASPVLFISVLVRSPSSLFSFLDSFQSWNHLRSLFVYGTRMGPSGLRHVIELGISHLQTLTLGQTGMTHHFGGYIGGLSSLVYSFDPCRLGGQLVQSQTYSNFKVPQTISCSSPMMSLYKVSSSSPSLLLTLQIYIEQEAGFSDRGVISLLKCLQYNKTVKILAFRGCNITNRGATACASESPYPFCLPYFLQSSLDSLKQLNP